MRLEASRELLASRSDVWGFLSQPYHLADWWPTISSVRPDRRGFAPGARWDVAGSTKPTLFHKPRAAGVVIVKVVELHERVVWTLGVERLDLEVRLRALAPDRTLATVAIEGRWRPEGFGRPRVTVRAAADRLYELVQTAASLTETTERIDV